MFRESGEAMQPYWKSSLADAEALAKTATKAEVFMLGQSAGGRNIYMFFYGKKNELGRTANLSSALGARNPAFYAYYQRQLARGKTKPQALILISRRLISIIYGMLKNKTEYVMPKVQGSWD